MTLTVNLSFLIPQPTGLATYALNVLPHLRSLDPVLFAPPDLPDSFEGFRCDRVPATMTADQGAKGHLRRLIWTQTDLPRRYRAQRSSLLFCPIPEAPLWAGCRTIVMAHDLIPLRFFPKYSRLVLYTRWYVPRVLHQAQHIVCNSEATAADLVDFFGIPARKITPIPLAYDSRRYRPLNLPIRPYFLYVGRNDPYKNLQRAIAAFAAFLPQAPPREQPWEFWLAGPTDPRYHGPLVDQVRELGLDDWVRFLGYVPLSDLPRLLNQATALVFPSLWEGFGLPVLEAMACGTPAIAGRRASLPEVAGDAALWVDPESVADLARGMVAIASEPRLRADLSRRGCDRAAQFSWERTGTTTAQLLSSFL